MVEARGDLSPAIAIAIQQRASGAAVTEWDGMDDSDGTGRRNGDSADGGLRLALQFGGFPPEDLQDLLGVAVGLVALVCVKDQ